jgi:hypothetical protein
VLPVRGEVLPKSALRKGSATFGLALWNKQERVIKTGDAAKMRAAGSIP